MARPPARRPMRWRRGSRRGLSEIVGALMLVLIVVAAATSFALFIASYEKTLQNQRNYTQQRALESLRVLRVTPTLNGGGTAWSQLNFTVASLYINPATVIGVSVNNNPLKQYSVFALNTTTGLFSWATIGAGGQLALGPRAVVNLIVNCSNASSTFSFYNGSFLVPTTSDIKIEVFTAYQNDFQALFLPPTAIGIVVPLQTWTGSMFVTVPVLDGSASFQPGNETLVQWIWNITPDNTTYVGEKVVATFNGTFTLHHLLLEVVNSDGLIGIDHLTYP